MKKIDEKFEIDVKVIGNEQNYDFVFKNDVFEMINDRLANLNKDVKLYSYDERRSDDSSLGIKLNNKIIFRLDLSDKWVIKSGKLYYKKNKLIRILKPYERADDSSSISLSRLLLSDERIEKAWDGESSEFTYTFTVPLNEWLENITKLKTYS